MTVRVLIAIVTHNGAEVIAEWVERLARLSEAEDPQVEIVVADNASGDGTIGILYGIQERRPQIPLRIVPSNRNRGWGAGNYLAIDARPWPTPVSTSRTCAHWARGFRSTSRAGRWLLPSWRGWRGRRGRSSARTRSGDPQTHLGGSHRREGSLSTVPGVLLRSPRFLRDTRAYASGALALVSFPALQDAGMFDERIFMFHDDIDMTRRILGRGHSLIGVGDARGQHIGGRGSRIVGDSAMGTSTASPAYESELVFVEKWYGRSWALVPAAYRWHAPFHLQPAPPGLPP